LGGISLEFGASANVIESNLVGGVQGNAIWVDSWSQYNSLLGNSLGVDPKAAAHFGNAGYGIYLGGSSLTRIGGVGDDEGNCIGGNNSGQIMIEGFGGELNWVLGNSIGVNASGSQATPGAGPQSNGINVFGARRCLVGGLSDGERNDVAGNPNHGIVLSRSSRTLIAGNRVGLTRANSTGPANCTSGLGGGIGVWASVTNYIAGNIVANHQSPGIWTDGSPGNLLSGNSLYRNKDGYGIWNNDAGLALAPVITQAVPPRAPQRVVGLACPNCRVEVFSDAKDQGRVYEGSTIASMDGSFTFSKPGGFAGPAINATAIWTDGTTSGFSMPILPDLAAEIGLSMASRPTIGSPVRVRCGFSNLGVSAAAGPVFLGVQVPAGFQFRSSEGASCNASSRGEAIQCSLPALLSGGSIEVLLDFATSLSVSSPARFEASVSTFNDQNSANDSAELQFSISRSSRADLGLSLRAPESLVLDQESEYRATVTNFGSKGTSLALRLRGQLPAGVQFVSGEGAGWQCSEQAGKVECTREQGLAEGASTEVRLRVRPTGEAGTAVQVDLTLECTDDQNLVNNQASVSTRLRYRPDRRRR